MRGFLPESVLQHRGAPEPTRPQCGKCGLDKQCRTPNMKPGGQGRRRVLIVGEAPGVDEDRAGSPFVGASGELLRRLLLRCDVNFREDCWIINALACHPKNNWVKDEKAVEYCRPNVTAAIDAFDPDVIVPLGTRAVRSIIGRAWKEDTKGVMRWAGFVIPCRRPNAWICPSYHPSFVLRRKEQDKGLSERILEEHLREAFSLSGKPWKKIPDYASKVTVMTRPDEAAEKLRGYAKGGAPLAFDYETTCLKPDGPDARIVCCSVCYAGKETISYPWAGAAVTATKELLAADNPKIASNAKFEDRWSKAVAGVTVKNWRWDTMVMSHVLDPRHGITSIKFQAFVRLGQEDYDGHVKGLLKGKVKGGNERNRIDEVETRQLLLYCGLDSYLEYRVAEMQAEELGWKL